MRFFVSLMLRILATLLVIGLGMYFTWKFTETNIGSSFPGLCLAGVAIFPITLYLFWRPFSDNYIDGEFRIVVNSQNMEKVLEKLAGILRQHKFTVHISQFDSSKLEAIGDWWVFTEKIQALLEKQPDDNTLVRLRFYVNYISSFPIIPMVPFAPAIFVTARVEYLWGKIQDTLKLLEVSG